jgi:hypothetical protein
MRTLPARRSPLVLALLCLVPLACGSPQSAPPADPDPVVLSPEEQREREALERLRIRQEAACERLCPRMTDCSIAEARATLPPDEVARLELDKTAPAHTADCKSRCKRSDLSPRQVRVYEVCVQEEEECGPLLACLDHANPGR